MTIYQTIEAAITKGKDLSIEWALKFITNNNYGEENCCGEMQLGILETWVGLLRVYNTQHFRSDGTPIGDPELTCLTQAEALKIVANINEQSC